MTETSSTPQLVEFLYGRWWDDELGRNVVVEFRITKKTAKRIYYIRRAGHGGRSPYIGFVNRQALEADGEVSNRSLGWWEPDAILTAQPPAERPQPMADVAALKTAMVNAHPDRGGTDAEFIAARSQYEQAIRSQATPKESA